MLRALDQMSIWQDLRLAARTLRKHPGFLTLALTTVALGIGANTTMLGVADALFLRLLPVPEAHEIVHVDERRQGDPATGYPLSLSDYVYYRERSRSFTALAAHYPTSPMHLVIDRQPSSITGSVVTASYFTVLGVPAAAGRFFGPADDATPGREAVVVIGYELWQQRFLGDLSAIGSTISINGTPFTVIGVAPRELTGVLMRANVSQVWIPSSMFAVGYRYCNAFDRGCRVVQMLGRLAPGIAPQDAQTELDVLARQLEAAYPGTNRGRGLRVMQARGVSYAGDDTRVTTLLLASVGVLLVITCANLAGLLLARGLGRRKEIAARLALGANRGRIIRQLLTESVLLSVAGGVLGVLLAFWLGDVVEAFYASDYAGRRMNFDLRIGPLVTLATGGLSILTGVVFGLLPAWHASRADVMAVLRDQGVTGSAWRPRLQQGLVVAQVMLSIVLLIGATLVVRSLGHVLQGSGFNADGVVVLRLRPGLVDYGFEKAWMFQRDAIRRLEALPGVIAASPSEFLPVFGQGENVAVWAPERPPLRAEDRLPALTNHIGARFFQTLGVPLTAGREFTAADEAGAETAIVSETLARRLWPDAPALGRMIAIDGEPAQVIGVVRDVQYHNAINPLQPYVYRNYWRQPQTPGNPWSEDSRTHVRVAGDAAAMMPLIRRELAAIDPNVPLNEDYPLRTRIGFHFQPVRVTGTLLAGFGAVAAFLSAIGLYGVLALSAQHRRRELAIRIALGAERRSLAGIVLRQGARLSAIGIVLGLVVAAGATGVLQYLLYGVSAHDPLTFAVVPSALALVALAASYAPARRAATVDPAAALRSE